MADNQARRDSMPVICQRQVPPSRPSSLYASQAQSAFLRITLQHRTQSLSKCLASRDETLVPKSVHSPTQSPDHRPCQPAHRSLEPARIHFLQLELNLPMMICEEPWNLGRSEMRSSASVWCLSRTVCSSFRVSQFGFGMIYLLRRSSCRSRMIRRMELWAPYWSLV